MDTSEDSVKVLVTSLLEAFKDKDESVNDAIHKSLCKIAAGTHANQVLLTLCSFCNSKKKIDNNHIINILRVVEQICMQQGEHLEKNVIHALTDLIIKEMVSSMEYIPEIQMPASGILVAIGNHWCNEVIEPLLKILKPGIIPHYTIVHTLGTLAATNISGTVPHLKVVLSKMLPTLGMLKIDPLKQAFSYALGNFCTALNDYFGNEKLDSIPLKKIDFTTEISIAFDVLYVHWLHSSEPKVVENVLEAIGPMFSLLSFEKARELVPKLIPIVSNIYKKSNVDAFFVTQAITLILGECVTQEVNISAPLIEMINQTMFHSVLIFPDYDHPQKIKNHFELLRCFDILATNFSEQIVDFLFLQTKNNNDDEKMRSLIILTHLVTSSEISVKVIVGRFTAILKTMIITESSCKMKRILLKAIVALAYRQYLNGTEDAVLIEFIIKQCSSEYTPNNKSEFTFLIDDCENSLYLLSSTVPNMKKILWPILTKSLLEYNDNETLSIICKCLSQLSKVEGEEEQESIVQEPPSPSPSNESLYVRCMSLLTETSDGKIITNIINFLTNYCGHINDHLKVSWEIDLKKLLTFYDSKNFDTDIWDSMVMDLFRSSIYLVNDNKWIDTVSHKIMEQIPKNDRNVQRKGLLYKYLCILLCHVIDLQSVNYRLDTLFVALHNCSLEEGKQISRALGIASIKHGLTIVEKLNQVASDVETKKSNRLFNFNFMKNAKQEYDAMNLRMSLTQCYGEIAKEVLDEHVLESLIASEPNCGALNWSISQLKNAKQHALKLNALNTIELLAKAVKSQPNPNVAFGDKWTAINLVLDQMFENGSKEVNVQLYPSVIQVVISLVKLPPYFAPEERNLILRTVCEKVYNSMNLLKTKFNNAEEESSNDRLAKFLNDSLISLNSLIKEFMLQSVCPSTLDDFLSILEEWVDSNNDEVRTSVMRSIQVVLICFIQNVKLTYENPSKFNQAGLIIGKMVPRCGDKSSTVRYIAIDCIKILIQIIDLYEGRCPENNSETFQNLAAVQLHIGTNDLEKFSSISEDLGDVISSKIPHHQTIHLIESLLCGLYGEELPGIICNVVLEILIKRKGQDLYQSVTSLMDNILPPLLELQGNNRDGLLKVILIIATFHTKSVVEYLLLQPLPFQKSVELCWETLANDENVAKITVEILCKFLTSELLFEESLKYENSKVVSVRSLSSMSALYKIVSRPEVHKLCVEKFPEIFSIVYTIFASFIGADPPAHTSPTGAKSEKYGFVPNHQATKLSPQNIALDTLEQFLNNSSCEKAAEVCSRYSQTEGDLLNSFFNMASQLVEAFCKFYPQHLTQIVSSLNPYSRSALIAQRIASAAFFANMVKYRCVDNNVLLETVMATLNLTWKDTALEVRAASLVGLSNIKYLRIEQCELYLFQVMHILYNALDDYQGSSSKTNLPLVAMNGLYGLFVLKFVKDKRLNEMPPFLQRIKSFFNTENPALREISTLLFGEIVHSGTSEEYASQAVSVFPCFVFHLADDDLSVVKACKQTLRRISPLMDADKTNSMIQTHLIDSAKLHLSEFTVDLMKRCTTELPDCVPQFIDCTFTYLNSPWDNIRANATLVVGILFLNYSPNDDGYDENQKRLTVRLLQLLKDSNYRVRAAAATSLSNLYQASEHHNDEKTVI